MRIGAVDFPEPLLAAQRNGSLVIFAGAGVSVPPPSNYPDLNNLARKLADGAPVRREQGEPIDRFLGRLKYQGVPVHERVREVLDCASSKPTQLHYDLLRLFSSPADVRLVTTNFDPHFTQATVELFRCRVEAFYAPALPLGHQLGGIVYLHGNVEKDPERIVLTDDDFGRAYLTEGWATRFLQSVFANYTVLFVGYSHNDPVMNYLSRGLPPEVRDLQRGRAVWRFALTPEGSAAHWEFLDITPISYPLLGEPNRHAALVDSIAAWVRLSRMGRLDHQQRIRRLVAQGLPLDGEEEDYLAAVLRDPETARFFARYARTPQWLDWVEKLGLLKPLFQPEPVDEVGAQLADWFAREFAIRHPEEALALVQRHPRGMNRLLWEAIARRLLSAPRGRGAPGITARWIALLLPSTTTPAQTELLTDLLESRRHPADRTAALLLFERLTRPRWDLRPPGPSPEGGWRQAGAGSIRLEGDVERLRGIWAGLFRSHLAGFVEPLLPMVAGHIQQARLLLVAAEEGGEGRPGREEREGRGRGTRARGEGQEAVAFLEEVAGELLRQLEMAHPGREVLKLWQGASVSGLRHLAEEIGDEHPKRAA